MCNFCAIIAGGDFRHNGMTDKGAPVIVTYTFTPANELSGELSAATNALKKAARQAADHIEKTAGIEMVEVGKSSDAMIDIHMTNDPSGVSYAYYPLTNDTFANTTSDLVMNTVFDGFSKGGFGYEILLHEFGHALGLKHPFDDSPRLPERLDNTDNTLMSYTTISGPKSKFQKFDKQALHDLYGDSDGLDGVSISYSNKKNVLSVGGTNGKDTLIGINDANKINGRGHNDIVIGRDSDDTLTGAKGRDSLEGMGGEDILNGGRGSDRIWGGDNDDRLLGKGGNDRLFGEDGRDNMIGGGGNDTLDGGSGRDTLAGGKGEDRLSGGFGADIFRIQDAGDDVIADLNVFEGDKLDVSGLSLSRSEALSRLTQDGNDMLFDAGGSTVRLLGQGNLDFLGSDFMV